MKIAEKKLPYWLLFISLCASFPWIKWLILVGAAIFALGIPIYVFWDNPAGFILGGCLLFLGITMNTVSLPNQMLAINSSKQIGMLPNIRLASYVIFAMICLFTSVMNAGFYSLTQHQLVVHAFWASLFLLSIVLIGNIVAAQKYQIPQNLIFFFAWAIAPIFKWLMGIHWAILFICLISVWVAFFIHWMRWIPTKFQQNILGMSRQQIFALQGQRAAQINAWFGKIFAVKAVNLSGSILLGRADGCRSKVRASLGMLIGLLLMFSIFFMLSDKSSFKFFFLKGWQANIYICYFFMANGLVLAFFRNINKLWLYLDGARNVFFHRMEKIYITWVSVMGFPIVLIHGAITYFILDVKLYGDTVWMTAVYAFVTVTLTFYLNLAIYQKTKGNVQWNIGLGIFLLFALDAPVIAANNMWLEHTAEIKQITCCSIAILAVFILVLRSWVKNKWMSVDFVKVKS